MLQFLPTFCIKTKHNRIFTINEAVFISLQMSLQVSVLLSSFDELVKKVDHLTLRVDKLEDVKVTQSTQLDNCLRSVATLFCTCGLLLMSFCHVSYLNQITFTESRMSFYFVSQELLASILGLFQHVYLSHILLTACGIILLLPCFCSVQVLKTRRRFLLLQVTIICCGFSFNRPTFIISITDISQAYCCSACCQSNSVAAAK